MRYNETNICAARMAHYRFGNYVFNSVTGELSIDDQPMEMRPKIAALLALFLEHRGELLSKSMILDRVWPETSVSDQTLFQAVRELRSCLGSSARDERFICNYPKKGYRWVFDAVQNLAPEAPSTRDSAMPHPTDTARLDRFDMQELLGRGGMASVWKAHDPKLNRTVAIKTFRTTAVNEQMQLRFEREMQALAAFNHPSIAQIYEVGEAPWPHENPAPTPFLVMEYVPGKTLRETLSNTHMPLAKAINLATQILQGLAIAHDRGMVHRDIKPENVMVTPDDRVKILDLGLAKLVADLGDWPAAKSNCAATVSGATREGTFVGTPGYMAPEQLEGGAVDARADIFSFGLVLYELIMGRPLFQAAPLSTQVAALLQFQFDSAELPAVAKPYARVLARCLAQDPQSRYHHARDVYLDLQEVNATAPERVSMVRRPFFWASIVTLTLMAAWINALQRPRVALPEANMRVVAEDVDAAIIAPDGTRFAFTRPGESAIWTAPLGSGETRELLRTDEAIGFLAADPHGEFLLFDATDGNGGVAIYEVPWSGGAVRRVTSGWMPAVSPDGSDVACLVSDQASTDIVVANRDGSGHRVLHQNLGSDQPRGLAFGPSGNALFLSRTDGYHRAYLTRFDRDGGVTRFGDVAGWCSHGIVVREPDLVVWGVLESDGLGPNVVISEPGESDMRRLFTFPGRYWYPSCDRAGTSLLVRHEMLRSRLTVLNENAPSNPLSRHLDFEVAGAQPRFSKQGDRLAYVTRQYEIWTLDLASGVKAPAIATGVAACNPAWSPDGGRLAYSCVQGDQSDIWLAELNGEAQPLLEDSANDFQPEWHPDGTLLYWVSDRDGQEDVYRMDLGTGELSRCTYSGGVNPAVSADGRFLAYVRRDVAEMVVTVRDLDANGQPTAVRLEARRPLRSGLAGMRPRFSPQSHEVAFDVVGDNGRVRLTAITLDGSAHERVIVTLPRGASLTNWYDWGPDDLIVAGLVQSESRLVLIPQFDRWLALFK